MSQVLEPIFTGVWPQSKPRVLSQMRRGKPLWWITLVVVGVALLIDEHSWQFAANSGEEQVVETDLISTVAGSTIYRQLGYLSAGALGAWFLLAPGRVGIHPRRGLLILIIGLNLWIGASALWSDDFMLSAKRAVLPTLSLILALGLAKQLRPRDFCLLMASLAAGYLVIGIVAQLACGTLFEGDRFSGTLHPNRQAINCAILSLAALALYLHSKYAPGHETPTLRPLLLGGALLFGLTFLYLTKSRTSLMALLPAVWLMLYVGATPARKFLLWCALGTATFMASLLILSASSDNLIGIVSLGRDQENEDVTSLTGRVPIWEEVTDDIARRPILGYGYGAFWTASRVAYYATIHDWAFDHAHSAYLETAVNIGVAGLLLGLLIVAFGLRGACTQFAATRDPGVRFVLGLLVFALFHGLLDSNFVRVGFACTALLTALSIVALQHVSNRGEASGTEAIV